MRCFVFRQQCSIAGEAALKNCSNIETEKVLTHVPPSILTRNVLSKHKGFICLALKHVFFNYNLIIIINVVAINSFLPIGFHIDPDVDRASKINTSYYAMVQQSL